MRIPGKLRRVFISGLRSLRRRRQRKAPPVPIEGVAEGITFETLNEVCLQYLGEPLVRVAHLHLSGWKSAGSYRLLLWTEGGHQWRLIYKNAIYTMDQIPALAKLPVAPGPPEYLLYSNAGGTLIRYLPAVYLCSEVIPGRHYQYLLEDVGQEYRKDTRIEAVLRTVAALPVIHRALDEWSRTVDQDRLLRYGYEFSAAFQEYARETLERYARWTANEAVSEVCRLWPRVVEVYLREEFHDLQTSCPIHGDFNPANVLVHQEDPDQIKLVDWEWLGLGVPHADLASLLGGRDPEVEQRALAIFFEQDDQLSLDEHRRLYQWCKLERGLLNAAFCAAQFMGHPTLATELSLPRVVDNAARRVLRMVQELA